MCYFGENVLLQLSLGNIMNLENQYNTQIRLVQFSLFT